MRGIVGSPTSRIPDNTRPDLIHIKVGRTNDVLSRLSQHRRNCPTFMPILLGFYPPAGSTRSADPPQYCDRLERLVHDELADLSANSYPTGRNAPRPACADC